MSAYMHHEEYDPEIGPPTKQSLIELIDKYSDRPFIPVFHLVHNGTFTNLGIYTTAKVGDSKPYLYITDDPNSVIRLRFFVGCRECYELLKLRLQEPTEPFAHLQHRHN